MSLMTAQQIMQDSHLTRVRELRDEVIRLKGELARACEERDSLRQHFAIALMAARDAEFLSDKGIMLIVDGWNAILGSVNIGGRQSRLTELVRVWLKAHPNDRAWIVFDGPRVSGSTKRRLRISYSGGEGAHRADRLVCDYLRMRQYTGQKGHVIVLTNDKAFRSEAARLGAEISGIEELNGDWVMTFTKEKEKVWIKK